MDEKDNIKEIINSLFSSIIESDEKEIQKNYIDIINNIKNSKYNLDDPDEFEIMINYQIKKILGTTIKQLYCNPEKINQLKFLFLNYSFLNSNITKLIIQKEGTTCSVDKSRHILSSYKNYLLSNFIPKLINEKHYWIFNFGDYKDWFEFCDSLYLLYYGNPKNYLIIYNKLLNEEVRKYKVIHYIWYVKLKNGYIFEISDSYSKKVNPLEDKSLMENNNYLIQHVDLNDKRLDNYPIHKKYKMFHLVPKEDIIECYCEEKEEIV